ncbi:MULTISPECIES: right-handed parallel beta-helix repeat-containing protein [unclassified Mycobacterium]|uniref:right-handed parallel beta-helix repeat-containing protein n=1 Tax=unclassified Mycobacterium TaxID=2642494 RepID=UPI0008944D51|nr:MULTISPECIES: right-handed parallel beta-helix repeat-containing protein [unclassified Mycobacterium]SEB26696.1 Right handed beta helix region [Mycobacterium sp. 283mftsu]
MGMPLSRRTFVRVTAQTTAAAAAGLFAGNPGQARGYAVPIPTYYISSTGDDSNDGQSQQSAWATLQKANDSLPQDRSLVLFRRGDTFYGEFILPAGCEVGAYGTGAKPTLTMYKLLNKASGWSEDSPGIWTIDLGSPDTHDGYNATNDTNIGFLLVDQAVKPALKFDLSELRLPWDFFCDRSNHLLYVKASANPTTLAREIKAAPHGDGTGAAVYCNEGGNNIHDIHVTGSGGHGIRGLSSNIHIHECQIDYIGGSILDTVDRETRFGNGIECWTNVSHWMIENNEIAHVYDVAWTAQGHDAADDPVFWHDLVLRNNHIHDCGQTVEFWSQSSNPASPGFTRVQVEGNRCERAGYGAFSDVRPDQSVRVHLLTYLLETPVDITIQNNVFDDAYAAFSYHGLEPPAGYVTRNNRITMRAGRLIEGKRPETVEQFAEWRAITGREIGSTMTVLR